MWPQKRGLAGARPEGSSRALVRSLRRPLSTALWAVPRDAPSIRSLEAQTILLGAGPIATVLPRRPLVRSFRDWSFETGPRRRCLDRRPLDHSDPLSVLMESLLTVARDGVVFEAGPRDGPFGQGPSLRSLETGRRDEPVSMGLLRRASQDGHSSGPFEKGPRRRPLRDGLLIDGPSLRLL
jgi:hypothetical protein